MENQLIFDLQGNKKQFAYQFTQKNFEAVLRDYIGQGKYKIECNGQRTSNRYVAYLVNGSDLRPLFSVWIPGEELQLASKLKEMAIPLIAEQMHSDSVKMAIEKGEYQQEYMCGRMSKEDIRDITKPFFTSSPFFQKL